MTQKDHLFRVYGLSFICTFLLEKIGKYLTSDSMFYRHENKMLLNRLMLNNKVPLFQAKQVYEGSHKKLEGMSFDGEIMEEELLTELKIFENFCEIYYKTQSAMGITDLGIYLDNLNKGKKLYTEVEIMSILKRFASETTIVQYTDDKLKEYLC